MAKKVIKTKIKLLDELTIRRTCIVDEKGDIWKVIAGYGKKPQKSNFNVRQLDKIYDAYKQYPAPYIIVTGDSPYHNPLVKPWLIDKIYTAVTHPEYFI